MWRHPSELANQHAGTDHAKVLAARRKWLQSTPSRAGAGAAGLVGALLATGVVLIGTHLTAWMTRAHPAVSAHSQTKVLALTTDTSTTLPMHTSTIAGQLASLSAALVRVRAVGPHTTVLSDGAFISPNGYIAVAASAIAGATSISVVRSDGEELIATVVGRDQATGIAVLRIAGSSLPWLELSPDRRPPLDDLVLTAWRTGDLNVSVSSFAAAPRPASLANGPALLQVCPRSLALGGAPIGSLVVRIVGGENEIAGMVVGQESGQAVVAPGWLLQTVSGYLIADGHVIHGWLGITGSATRLPVMLAGRESPRRTADHHKAGVAVASRTGVKVLSVQAKSAAARAGLVKGDIIEAVNGQRVTNMAQLQALLYLMAPSASVKLEVIHGQTASEVNARLQSAA